MPFEGKMCVCSPGTRKRLIASPCLLSTFQVALRFRHAIINWHKTDMTGPEKKLYTKSCVFASYL